MSAHPSLDMMVRMDSQERANAEHEIRVLALMASAMERRDEVFEIVASSEDPDEAQERIRVMFGVRDPHISQVVLDSQMSRWTRSWRKRIADRAEELRRLSNRLAPLGHFRSRDARS